jgi:hypothetical protein
MTLDPVIADLLKSFVFPVIEWSGIILAIYIQVRERKPHPLIYAMMRELVVVGTFKADNLINMGILKDKSDPVFNPLELIKILKGG